MDSFVFDIAGFMEEKPLKKGRIECPGCQAEFQTIPVCCPGCGMETGYLLGNPGGKVEQKERLKDYTNARRSLRKGILTVTAFWCVVWLLVFFVMMR